MHTNQEGGPAECVTEFEEIRVGQYFEFRGERYKKVALSMAKDEKGWGNVFSAETEVRPLKEADC